MLHNHRYRYDEALNLILFLGRLELYAGAGTKILDFGCGEGRLVYRLRELGFDAYGFDIHERVKYRNDDDRRYFRFLRGLTSDISDTRIETEYSISFPDGTFDIVYSSNVIEHVIEIDPFLRECARVLKPDGLAVHVYPAMLALVEPHILVPLASFFHPRWWLGLWAWAGVRNQFQTTCSAKTVIGLNEKYLRTGLKYYTQNQLLQTAARYFEWVDFPNRHMHLHQSWWAYLREKWTALRDPHPFQALARTQRSKVITCERPRPICVPDQPAPQRASGDVLSEESSTACATAA
jgi:SAM-dependent methyltransferase